MMKKWKTILVIILMILALWFNWSWVWIILLLFAFVQSIYSKEIHLIEVVKKDEDPLLYYILLIFWGGLTLISIEQYLRI